MNKGYLSKKSWHTGSLRHIEKVWKAEQASAEEAKRIAQLRKELEEERELQNLRQIHQQTTGFSKCVVILSKTTTGSIRPSSFVKFLRAINFRDERLDWMYHDPMISSGPSADEYLLGKAYKEKPEEAEVSQVRLLMLVSLLEEHS